MLRSLYTICLALLLPSLGTGESQIVSVTISESFSSVRGKQCYDCTVVSGSKDQCGNFDQWTPKCNVASDGDCLKSTIQGSVFLNLARLLTFFLHFTFLMFTYYTSGLARRLSFTAVTCCLCALDRGMNVSRRTKTRSAAVTETCKLGSL